MTTHRSNSSRFVGAGNAALAAMAAAALGLGNGVGGAFRQLAASRTDSYDGSGPDGSVSPLSAPLEYTPESAEAKLVDYREEKVAAFEVDNETMICLPQAYDLFLKHLVGGLHTVYTKLKRLEITPFVCNVEQVRALRSIGAIQPGVNRCKLISRRDFDVLYEDCASSSSRPGRPPKRSPLFSASTGAGVNGDFYPSTKRPKLTPDTAATQGKTSCATSASNPILNPMLSGFGQFNPNLFPLFPFAHQQMMMTQLPNFFVKRWSESDKSGVDESDGGNAESKVDVEDSNRSVSSADSSKAVVIDASKSAASDACDKRDVDADAEAGSSRYVAEEPAVRYGADSPSGFGDQPFNLANVFGGSEFCRRGTTAAASTAAPRVDDMQSPRCSSVQNLLLSVVGLIEAAAATARKQEEQLAKEKLELCKAYEEEKRERTRLERLLREEQKLKCVYIKRWRHAKRQKAEANGRDQKQRHSVPTSAASNNCSQQKQSAANVRQGGNGRSFPTQTFSKCSTNDRHDSQQPNSAASTKCFGDRLS